MIGNSKFEIRKWTHCCRSGIFLEVQFQKNWQVWPHVRGKVLTFKKFARTLKIIKSFPFTSKNNHLKENSREEKIRPLKMDKIVFDLYKGNIIFSSLLV